MKRGEWFLLLFNLAYIIPFTIYYISIRNFEFLGYILILVLIFLAIIFTLRKTKFDYFILWGLSIWGLLHMAGGGVLVNGSVLYRYIIYPFVVNSEYTILKFDQFVHFYLYVFVAIAIVYLLKRQMKKDANYGLILLVSALAAVGIGGLNEIAEFIMVLSLPQTGVGGYYNTAWDLVANTLGAILGVIIAHFRYKNIYK